MDEKFLKNCNRIGLIINFRWPMKRCPYHVTHTDASDQTEFIHVSHFDNIYYVNCEHNTPYIVDKGIMNHNICAGVGKQRLKFLILK